MITQGIQFSENNIATALSAEPIIDIKTKQKNDAIELATLIYDIYKEVENNARIKDGQNDDNMS